MRRFRLFVDFDKEERYLKDMAKKGYRLKKHTFLSFYQFEPMEPADMDYRIDYRAYFSKADYEEYLILFEDAGWEHIAGSRFSGSHYFLPKQGMSQAEDIHSDAESKAGRYRQFLLPTIFSFGVFLLDAFAFWFILLTPNEWSYLDPRSWYYSPGLWEDSGAVFLIRFMIETPFVIMRVILPPLFALFALTMMVAYGLSAAKAYQYYHRTLSKRA
jgi:hypothetical protein